MVDDIKTNLTAYEISVSKVVKSTPKTQPQTKHEKKIFKKIKSRNLERLNPPPR